MSDYYTTARRTMSPSDAGPEEGASPRDNRPSPPLSRPDSHPAGPSDGCPIASLDGPTGSQDLQLGGAVPVPLRLSLSTPPPADGASALQALSSPHPLPRLPSLEPSVQQHRQDVAASDAEELQRPRTGDQETPAVRPLAEESVEQHSVPPPAVITPPAVILAESVSYPSPGIIIDESILASPGTDLGFRPMDLEVDEAYCSGEAYGEEEHDWMETLAAFRQSSAVRCARRNGLLRFRPSSAVALSHANVVYSRPRIRKRKPSGTNSKVSSRRSSVFQASRS